MSEDIKKISDIMILTDDGTQIPAKIVLPLTQIEVSESENLQEALSWTIVPSQKK